MVAMPNSDTAPLRNPWAATPPKAPGNLSPPHSNRMSIALTVPERAQRVVASDLEISILGPCEFPSPLADRLSQAAVHYVGQADRVLARRSIVAR